MIIFAELLTEHYSFMFNTGWIWGRRHTWPSRWVQNFPELDFTLVSTAQFCVWVIYCNYYPFIYFCKKNWLLTVWMYCILRYICVLASQRLIVACSFHPVAYGRGSLLWLHATWTKTLWVIYSGAGELSLPWTPASSGTPKAAISPLLCRSVAVLYSTPWSLFHCLLFSEPLFMIFFFCCHSWEFLIHLSWWATSTNSRMMTRLRSRALSSMYLRMLPLSRHTVVFLYACICIFNQKDGYFK